MQVKWWIVLAVVLVSALRADIREYPNLAYNPSFETLVQMPATDPKIAQAGDFGKMLQIEFWGARPGMVADQAVRHSGKNSLRIDGPGKFYTIATEQGQLLPETEYRLSAWAKGAGTATLQWAGEGAASVALKPGETEWQQGKTTFKSAAKPRPGFLRLEWKLAQGQSIWVDDIELAPADGKVSPAPAPVIETPAGSHEGPLEVSIKTDVPGASIVYTVDGSAPDIHANKYLGSFRLNGPALVKARAMAFAYQDSPVAQAQYELKPKVGPGVPFYPVGWGRDVQSWWDGHAYNPASKNHLKTEIVSPQTRVDVAAVHKEHPESKTAGIAEALAKLPPAGGTLWFPKAHGPYEITAEAQKDINYYGFAAAMLVLDRSNLHFLSDGATIRCPSTVWAFSAMEYKRTKNMQHPISNFYFSNLVFDGMGSADQGIYFQHSTEILLDNCLFKNYRAATSGHPGVVHAHAMSDNLWCRNCTFESGNYGVFLDGAHGCGLLDCTFGKGLVRGGILTFANNDMCPISAFQQSTQYLVVAGCRFEGAGKTTAMTMTASNVLIANNQASGSFGGFISPVGRGHSNMRPHLFYDCSGFRIVNNRVERADSFVAFVQDIAQYTRLDHPLPSIIEKNTVGGLDCLLSWKASGDPAYPPYSRFENVQVTNNRGTGPARPRIQVDASALDRIKNIVIKDNTLAGTERPLLTDLKGKPVSCDNIHLENNTGEQKP